MTQPSLSVAARYVGLLLRVQDTTISDVYEARMVLEPACACRFHELIMQRSGSKTLAVQGGVLQDIVATHLTLAITRGYAEDEASGAYRRSMRSYEKLVEKRDGTGGRRTALARPHGGGRAAVAARGPAAPLGRRPVRLTRPFIPNGAGSPPRSPSSPGRRTAPRAKVNQ